MNGVPTDKTSYAQKTKPVQDHHAFNNLDGADPVDTLLASLSKQQAILQKQSAALEASNGEISCRGLHPDSSSTSNSVPLTPATEAFYSTSQPRSASANVKEENGNTEEVSRLKMQLAQAQDKISRLGQELSSTRPMPKPLDSGIGVSPFEIDASFHFQPEHKPSQMVGQILLDSRNSHVQSRDAIGPPTWPIFDDSRSDTSESTNAAGFNRARHIWNSRQGPPAFGQLSIPPTQVWNNRAGNIGYMEGGMPYSAPLQNNFRPERLTPDNEFANRPGSGRRGLRMDNRFHPPGLSIPTTFEGGFAYNGTSCDGGSEYTGPPATSLGGNMNMFPGYTQANNTLSPLASEFTTSPEDEQWKPDVCQEEHHFMMLPANQCLGFHRGGSDISAND